MRNVLLYVCLLLLALFTAVTPCFADTVNGVLAEERVVNLPADQAKWYISVVGNVNDARYNEILGWFASNPSLVKLKSQVHFCQVTANTAIYKERYAANMKGLPGVRMQKADGTIVYEATGNRIPMTAAGLNGALAGAASAAQAIRPLLPWRREVDRRLDNCCPQPGPQPDPDPQPVDPDPDQPDTPDQPDVAAEWPGWLLAPICGVSFLVGLAIGYGRKLKDKLMPSVK